MKRFFSQVFWFIFAGLFIIETWLWDRVGGAIAYLFGLLPIDHFKIWLVRLIDRLPPYGVLAIFAVPIVIIEPVKFIGLDLIANGRIFSAIAVFLAAKVVGLGIIASLFRLCREKLLMIPWLKRLYEWLLRADVWAHAKIAPYRLRAQQALAEMRKRLKLKFGVSGAFAKRIAALRENRRRR